MPARLFPVALLLLGLLAPVAAPDAHAATLPALPSLAPAGWDDGLRLRAPVDTNPDPRIVEIAITARMADVEVAPGRRVRAWTYDGGIPGPFIRGHVGDRLIVHFRNDDLPEATTIHWHGLRLPIAMDGVPDVSQPPVPAGGTFTYDFVLRDAGLFWYHPHVSSAAQVGFGLYGALLVEDADDGIGVADQLTLVLSDIGVDDRGRLEAADSGGPAGMVFGREGGHLLVNGRHQPVLRARAGAPQRWRIVNTAKSRFFQLELEGHEFTVIGTDGGLQESPTTVPFVLVTAGERVDLIVTPTGTPGTTLSVRAGLHNRGYGSVEYRSVEDLFSIALSPEPALPPRPLPVVRRTLTPPTAEAATPVRVVLTLPPAGTDGVSEFHVNGVPYWKAKPFLAALGETQLWTIVNDSDWDHPFHLHGYFFMPVDAQGLPLRPMQWKDTLNIRMKTTARVLVTFDERPGEWMFHCHILDHAEGGLMGTVLVGGVAPTASVHAHPGGRKGGH